MLRRARVVLATYQQLDALPMSLLGYARQTSASFSITVADDGSAPAVGSFIEEIRPDFTKRGITLDHVWQEDRGFRKCAILNEAVRRSQGEPLLIFSDGDCIPPARFVERHLQVHEHRSLHVAGAYRLPRDVSEGVTAADVERGTYESLGSAQDLRWLRKRRRKSFVGTWLRRRNRPKIVGLNFAIDRTLFEEVNGFDERFATYGIGEDTDLRDRAMRCRPRPRVKNLYLRNDVFHMWHAPSPGGREASRTYYRTKRPARCEKGLRYDSTDVLTNGLRVLAPSAQPAASGSTRSAS